jgi:hypothetical protein
MMTCFKSILPSLVMAVTITGCELNDNPPIAADYSRGVYVVNEGSFTQSNGSISYLDPFTGVIINGIFEAANNNRPVGDVVQSFAIARDTVGYIVVNNSSKVEVVALKTFKTLTNPITVFYPRYFMQVSDDKGYLSAGSMKGYLYIIDLNSNIKADSIEVGYGPENMVVLNNKVYVINSGGWGLDSTISIVSIASDEVVDTINIGQVPADITLDANNNLWVYCKGYTDYVSIETDALLQKIDPATNSIVWQAKVGKALDYMASPAKCARSKDGSIIYYLRPNGVYAINAVNPLLQAEPLIPGGYYGLEVNPSDGNIYVFESSNFMGNGKLKIFDEDGLPVAEGIVGIGPNGAAFNL